MNTYVKKFFYNLPEELIAHTPSTKRDSSRLLQIKRSSGTLIDATFRDIEDMLSPNDILVLNNTKVFPARVVAKKNGRSVELLLLKKLDESRYICMTHPGLKVSDQLTISKKIEARVEERDEVSGHCTITFCGSDIDSQLDKVGKTPIPPYIQKSIPEEKLRTIYQTVYARKVGSAAAPTAGMHFTKKLISRLKAKGVSIEFITLHVGPGTFQRVWDMHIDSDSLHNEDFFISHKVAQRLVKYKKSGSRIIAAGTTTARALESAVSHQNIFDSEGSYPQIKSGWQSTSIFIHPPFKFALVDALITNFHLPESSLLMMISAFMSHPNTAHKFTSFRNSLAGQAYQHAMAKKYRFYSFGDAMLIE